MARTSARGESEVIHGWVVLLSSPSDVLVGFICMECSICWILLYSVIVSVNI